MNNTPKCPGCGADMELMQMLLCNSAFYYVCAKCGWGSPVGIDPESAFRMAMRRTEQKNRVLTLEEATGSDEPVWLEAMSRVFIADVCVSRRMREWHKYRQLGKHLANTCRSVIMECFGAAGCANRRRKRRRLLYGRNEERSCTSKRRKNGIV